MRALCGLLPLLCGSLVSAQTPALINPISYFQVQEGNSAPSWAQTGTSTDAAGNSVISFQDGNGGTATMTWSPAGTLANWTINPPAGLAQVYTDATPQGRPGSFVLTAGQFGTNNVLTINGHPYVAAGNLLQPAQSRYGSSSGVPIISLAYAGSVYSFVTQGTDYTNRVINLLSNGSVSCVVTEVQGLQIYLPAGTVASYTTDASGRFYTYQAGSTATNALSALNGYPLTAQSGILSLPAPITNFVDDGVVYTPSAAVWDSSGSYYPGTGPLSLQYSAANGSGVASAWLTPGGALYSLNAPSGEVMATSTPYVYSIYVYSGEANPITAINGIPYVRMGYNLVPVGPVSSFSYGGSTYQFTGASQAADGNELASFSTGGANPLSATAEYSPTTGALVKLSVNAPGGGTATYVDGASVGQPGAYVWSSASTAANALSSVNNNAYNAAGNSDLPGTATTASGVFQVKGNFLDLGSWSNNASQAGLSLSYYDGQTSTNPASVEFTGNRPLTSWVWDVASADGTASSAVMLLDQSSRLLLYPQAGPQQTTPSQVEIPAVTLDPNAGGTSQFSQAVRFDGPVRIAPQGDLSMGEFTAEPTPAP